MWDRWSRYSLILVFGWFDLVWVGSDRVND